MDKTMLCKPNDKDVCDGEENRLQSYNLKEIELESEARIRKKQKIGVKVAKCDKCILNPFETIAQYLCYVCDLYLCGGCLSKHQDDHEFVKLESEKSARETMAYTLLTGIRCERERGPQLDRENIRVYGRINVKYKNDKKECAIHGLCRVGNKNVVVLDSNNSRLKVYSTVTNSLIRHIQFGYQPWEATEIIKPKKSTDQATVSGSKTGVSASKLLSDEQTLLCVAFPWVKKLWLIDLNKTPAVKVKTIWTEEKCWSIDFSDNRIFCLCVEYVGLAYSIFIMSLKGKTLKVIQNDMIKGIIPNFVYSNGRIYFSDYPNNRIVCINTDIGSVVGELTIEGSGPAGITVDNFDNIYVCAKEHDTVYKLSNDLKGYESLGFDSEFTREPDRLCFVDNKLFIGHYWASSLQNNITVFQQT